MPSIPMALTAWIERRLSLPRALNRDFGSRPATARVIVFGRFPNPSFDYYFKARLAAKAMPPWELADIRRFDPGTLDPDGAFVIIVRYASREAVKWIASNRDRLSGTAYFIDDDLAGLVTGTEASLRYRLMLLRYAVLPLRRLEGQLDRIWVSTETLAERLSTAAPTVLPPCPADIPQERPRKGGMKEGSRLLVAYHATAIHVEEHSFLLPIIRAVIAARPLVHFEVFAGRSAARLWKSLGSSQITVRRPLGWQDYLHEQMNRRIDIMLVPISPNRANEARSETKRIDVARTGAAAIFSDCPAYRDGEEGELVLPYDQAVWTQALLELIDQPQHRLDVARATERRVHALAEVASLGLDLPTSLRHDKR